MGQGPASCRPNLFTVLVGGGGDDINNFSVLSSVTERMTVISREADLRANVPLSSGIMKPCVLLQVVQR